MTEITEKEVRDALSQLIEAVRNCAAGKIEIGGLCLEADRVEKILYYHSPPETKLHKVPCGATFAHACDGKRDPKMIGTCNPAECEIYKKGA